MQRKLLDKLISIIGFTLTAILIVAGSLLAWGHSFIGNEVHTQLSQQQIFFPPAGSDATKAPEFAPMRQYAGQQMTTGAQAKVYADSFIANHLKEVAGGKTYAQVSTAAQADPTNVELQGEVATLFKGETLRGLLLNAYAFGTMGTLAGIAAIIAFVGAALMLLLSALGLVHSRRVPETQTVPATKGIKGAKPVTV